MLGGIKIICFWELRCRNLFLAGIYTCFFFQHSFSQISQTTNKNTEFASIISILDSTAQTHVATDFYFGPGNLETLNTVFQPTPDLSQNTKSNLNNAKIELLRREYGVELKAGYLENIEEGIFGPGDIYYNRRAKLEMEWNILENGFFENRRKIKELEVENNYEEQKFARNQIDDKYGRLYNQLIYYFDQARIKTIEKYLSLENVLLQTSAELFRLNEIKWNEVLEEMGQKARLENKLKAYKNYDFQFKNTEIPELDVFALPLVDVNIEKILAENTQIDHFNSYTDSLNLNYNPLMDVNLSVFARYNIFGGAGADPLPAESFSGREYFSVGLDVSVPLFFNGKAKQKILELEQQQQQEEWNNESEAQTKEIYNHYYEYQFALQQYIQFHVKYLNVDERIKEQTLLSETDPEYSPRKLAKLLGERYEVMIALIDLKQKLYLKLLKLGSYNSIPVSDFVEPIDLNDYFEKLSDATKLSVSHIYIWSSDFEKFSNLELIDLLNKFSIKNIHLSVLESQSEKAKELVKLAHRHGIKVFLLVGNNQLIFYHDTRKKMVAYFQKAAELNMDGLHLDVEPQVFDDWSQFKTDYQNRYVGMLQSAHQLAQENGMSLSVSIPHYFEPILNQINQEADQVFIMVYETNNLQKIQKRIAEENSVLGCKMLVALRPEDFPSPETLRETMEALELESCQGFAFHDLGSFLKLMGDEK